MCSREGLENYCAVPERLRLARALFGDGKLQIIGKCEFHRELGIIGVRHDLGQGGAVVAGLL